MKKYLGVALAIITMAFCLSLSAFAGNLAEEFKAYTAGENDCLTWYVKNNTLFINGNDNMNDFCVWGDNTEHPEWYMCETNAPWRNYKTTVNKIVIGEGVKTIGWYAFYGFENLTDIYIPKTLKTVYNGAFGECKKLNNVYFAISKDEIDFLVYDNEGNAYFNNAKSTFSSPYVDGYTITYVLNGGKNNSANPKFYKQNTAVSLKSPTKTGYTFGGWYTESSYKNKITAIKSNANKNYTLYAKWIANTYTVKFNANGATGKMSSLTMKYGTEKALTANTFKKENYTFVGWNTKADGSGVKYKNKATVNNLTSKNGATVVLYAQWRRTQYTIAFVGNGATSGTTKSINAKAGTAYTLTENGFKRSCYTFTGWNTKSNGKGVAYTNGQKVKNLTAKDSAKITLYAQWKINKDCYTVSYKLDGGKNNAANPLAYAKKGKTILLKTPTRTGYTFIGWYTDSTYTKKVTALKSGSTGNKTFYAKWKANTYTIKFMSNGAKGTQMSALKCEYGKTYSLTANKYKMTGYAFNCWSTKADGSGTVYADKAKIKNLKSENGSVVTLYAQWMKPDYSGNEGSIKWCIYSNGLLTLDNTGTGEMNNYVMFVTTMMWGGTIRTSSAPWAARGTGTRDLVKTVKIGNGVKNIGKFAFSYCGNMTQITIPASVTYIGGGAFIGCDSLKDIYYGGTKAQWDKITIVDEDSSNAILKAVKIHYSE